MRRICLLYDFLETYGGLERVMRSQAKWLSSDYDVIVSFGSVNNNLRNFFKKNVEINEHSNKLIISKTLKIIYTFLNRRSLTKLKTISLFISHSFICSKLAYNMKKKFNIPYIVFIHHPPNFLYLQIL